MAFQFKQFKIEDDQSTMKVGTDSVLLGAYIQIKDEQHILDIGTGSGVISLMMAQKSTATIDAIDIDLLSIKQTSANFNNSVWPLRLNVIKSSLQDFCESTTQKYDLIVSNPPFFDQSLKPPKQEKRISKHTDLLSFNELAHGIKCLLNPNGNAYLILPPTEAQQFINKARIEGLFCNQKLMIKPTINKSINRVIMKISFYRTNISEKGLTIRDKNLNYTPEYKDLTKDFYLNF